MWLVTSAMVRSESREERVNQHLNFLTSKVGHTISTFTIPNMFYSNSIKLEGHPTDLKTEDSKVLEKRNAEGTLIYWISM